VDTVTGVPNNILNPSYFLLTGENIMKTALNYKTYDFEQDKELIHMHYKLQLALLKRQTKAAEELAKYSGSASETDARNDASFRDGFFGSNEL
jgi:hypothetical protein